MKYLVTVAGREIEVEVDGDRVTVQGKVVTATLGQLRGTPLRQLEIEGRPTEIGLEAGGQGRWAVMRRGERWEVEVVDERTRHIRTVTGSAGGRRGTPPLKAPMPGLVLRVLAVPGQAVSAGTGVVVLEAMKMENELRATVGSVVRTVRVQPGEVVEKGQVLVEFEAGAT